MSDNFQAWVSQLQHDSRVPSAVSTLAVGIFGKFFNNGVAPGLDASLFAAAPPIWQELYLLKCADGTIKRLNGAPLLRASWMPDQYLYHNGSAMTLYGIAGDGKSVMTGNFDAFSAVPSPANEDAYGNCDAESGRAGNPWNIAAIDGAGIDPAAAHFCTDTNKLPNPDYSG